MEYNVVEGEKVSRKAYRKSGGKRVSLNKTEKSSKASVIALNDLLLEKTLGFSNDFKIYLTEREKQILKFIVAGKTNKQIARNLCRTKRTIEYHRNRLMTKLEVHNAAELVKLAIAKDLI